MAEHLTDAEVADLRSLIEANSDPAATERLMEYWAHGEGAAKIRWGEPHDFYRCVDHLSKYVADAKGLCSNLHVRALGVRPGKEAAMPTPTNLVEHAAITGSPDAKTGVGIIQLITPGWGSSGYYSSQVLAEAARNRVFPKGTKMFVDHPTATEEQERPVRSVKDIAAVLTEDARVDGHGGLIGGIEVLPQYRESLAALAKHNAIGCSIRAAGLDEDGEAEGRPGRIVTALTEGQSVDFVTQAGRGGRVLVLESGRLAVTDESGEATLTSHVPVQPAGQSESQPPQENPMGQIQIEESELSRLRESAGRVQTLETELTEAKNREAAALRLLAETKASTAAAKRARDKVRKDNTALAAATVDRIVEAAVRSVPLIKDGERAGQLDEAAFDTRVDTARTAEETYLASLSEANGSGTIVGMGGGSGEPAVFTEADLDKAIAGAFGRTVQEVAV